MLIESFLGQLDVAFFLGDIDISVIPVRETIVEIQAAEFRNSPFDAGLGTHITDELMSVFLLILRRIERVRQFTPDIGFDGFAGNVEICTYTAAQLPSILAFLQRVDAIGSRLHEHPLAEVNFCVIKLI